jgi:hypothetical protein
MDNNVFGIESEHAGHGSAALRHADHSPHPGGQERLASHDIELHQRMLAKLEQATALEARAVELRAAWKIHCEDLHARYGLAVDGSEGVAPDGAIFRRPR